MKLWGEAESSQIWGLGIARKILRAEFIWQTILFGPT